MYFAYLYFFMDSAFGTASGSRNLFAWVFSFFWRVYVVQILTGSVLCRLFSTNLWCTTGVVYLKVSTAYLIKPGTSLRPKVCHLHLCFQLISRNAL